MREIERRASLTVSCVTELLFERSEVETGLATMKLRTSCCFPGLGLPGPAVALLFLVSSMVLIEASEAQYPSRRSKVVVTNEDRFASPRVVVLVIQFTF